MSDALELPGGQVVLEARDLRKDFPLPRDRRVARAVERASLTLSAGMQVPTRGEIRFKGACELKQSLHNVHSMFQDHFLSLKGVHTIRYHLSRPLALHGRMQMAVQVFLAQVNLRPAGQFLDGYRHQLSGGKRRRVSSVRALAEEAQLKHPSTRLLCPPARKERLPARTSSGDGHRARCFLSPREEDASCL
jgi:peptide/nickel transport system ATP-binding protein